MNESRPGDLDSGGQMLRGVLFAASSYFVWGILPLYWRLLAQINSMHILAFRILLSLLLCGGILFFRKNFSWLFFYRDRAKRFSLILASFAVCISWGLYIWAVNRGHTIEAALGYYITPLISIVLGMVFFKEKLKPLQIAAFSLAFIGVLLLTIMTGTPPWISLGLAFAFAIYGLLKKTIIMPALETLAVETLIVSPLGFVLLFTSLGAVFDGGYPNPGNISYISGLPPVTLVLLLFAGAATTLPLYLFSRGARMIPLSTLGFAQFISPTLTFLTGVFIFREPFPLRNLIVFGCIWSAVILYIISLKKGS